MYHYDTNERTINDVGSQTVNGSAPVADSMLGTPDWDTWVAEEALRGYPNEDLQFSSEYNELQSFDPTTQYQFPQGSSAYPDLPDLPESTFLHHDSSSCHFPSPNVSHLETPGGVYGGIQDKAVEDFDFDHAVLGQLLREHLDREASPYTAAQGPSRFEARIPPGKPKVKGSSKPEAKNRRPKNIKEFRSEDFYRPLPVQPRNWSPDSHLAFQHTANKTGTFQYTAEGELLPERKFTVNEIGQYLSHHPLHGPHGPHGRRDQRTSGLVLWVQTTPADSAKRYLTKESAQCRFANCPVENNTIRKGEFRVAFDEQWREWGPQVDPYHNAGYVHLFCIEKNFDFPRLCKLWNVRGDNRKFPEGRNKMAITRDHSEMLKIVNQFKDKSELWGPGERPGNWYDLSLCRELTIYHLENQPKKRQSVREVRNGNSIDRHLGNLDLMILLASEIKERKAGQEKKPRKRKVAEVEDHEEQEFVIDDKILDAEIERPPQKILKMSVPAGLVNDTSLRDLPF
jgi:hypothetical protein